MSGDASVRETHLSFRAYLDTLSQVERNAIIAQLDGYPMAAPQAGKQTEAFQSEADVLGFGGAAGGGKGFKINDLVATPTGMKEIGSLVSGSVLCDAYGGAQRIIRTKNWGDWKFLKVDFSDGTSVDVSPEHLWTCWRSHIGVKKRNHPRADKFGRVHGLDGARVMETSQILEGMESGYKYRVQLCEPAAGNLNRFKFDAYSLGVILGDGAITVDQGIHPQWHPKVSMAHYDGQVLEIMNQGLSVPGDIYLEEKDDGRADMITLKIPGQEIQWLKDMGIFGLRSWEKKLPKAACFAPIEWRWNLLAGLLDTDGWVEDKRCAYYCTTSPFLRDDVAKLARSLGCFVTISNKFPTYTYKGEKREGRPSYTLRIKSATPEKLFKLKRKKKIASRLKHQSLAKEITDITEIENHECFCITVNHPSGLYLTNDYTVTHNSSLGALLSIHEHERTVAFRREKVQLSSWVDDITLFAGTDDGLNRQGGTFRYNSPAGKKLIEWGGLKDPDDWLPWRGRPHDLIIYEEATEIPFNLVKKTMGWLRTTTPGQRCRVLMTFNPPGTPDEDTTEASQKIITSGRWVIDFFAPWLDERHPDPAEFGEIRYFYRDERGIEREKKDGKRVLTVLGEHKYWQKPQSRTFILSLVTDNKYLANSSYVDHLLSLEEPFRSQMLLGDFRSGIVDIPNQVIKTKWVDDAMERWEKQKTVARAWPMNALGVDVSRGGNANTILAPRRKFFIDELTRMSGEEADDGPKVAAKCIEVMRDNCEVNVDVIGPGTSVFDFLNKARVNVHAIKSQRRKDIPQPDPVEIRECYNLRASLWLLAKKMFDPANGCEPAIPNDKRLRSELIAVRQKTDAAAGMFQVEDKKEVQKRLGYSTDEADAVIYTLNDLLEEPWAMHLQSEIDVPIDNTLIYGRPDPGGSWMAR